MERIRRRHKLFIGTLSCKYCPCSFADFSRYRAHTKHHEQRYLKHWLTRRARKAHKQGGTNNASSEGVDSQKHQQWVMCGDGKVKITFTNGVEESNSSTFSCKVCNRAFSAAIHLTRHQRQAHTRPYGDSSGTDASSGYQADGGSSGGATSQEHKRKFNCEYCSKKHHNKADLDYHVACAHTGQTQVYTCEVCKSNFKRKVYLNRHMRIHNDIRPYVCKVCGKSFVKGGGLKEHERTHTGEKPYKCPTCGRGFSGRANLRRHEMTHSGEQPFQCEICHKRCNRIASLRQHMRIHTGERPYNCMHCNKSFPTCANLRRHERTHLERKQFHCMQCGKEFTQKYTLKLHEMNHLGIRPHLCLMCGKTFIEKRKLRQHLTMVHGVVQDTDDNSSDTTGSEAYSLDLALEGNKHLDLSNMQPFAGEFEGAHFKTISDFQAYWKVAHSHDEGGTSTDSPAQNAVDTMGKMKEILSRLSQNMSQNKQNPPVLLTSQSNAQPSITISPNSGLKPNLPATTTITASGFQPNLPTLTMTNSGFQIIDPKPTLKTVMTVIKTNSNTSTSSPRMTPQPAIGKPKPDTSTIVERPLPHSMANPEELKIIKKAMKKAKKQAKKEAKRHKREHKKNRAIDKYIAHQNAGQIENVLNGSAPLPNPVPEFQPSRGVLVQPLLSVPRFVASNHHHQSPINPLGMNLTGKLSGGNTSTGGEHTGNSRLLASSGQNLNKPQNGNFIFNRFNNLAGAHSCDQCGQTFTSDIVLDIHKRTHTPDEQTSFCIVCSKSFSNADMDEHIKTHNNEAASGLNAATPEMTAPKSTQELAALMSDMPNDFIPELSAITPISGGETYPAMIAASSPGGSSSQVDSSPMRKTYPCTQCGKEYMKRLSLKNHMKVHEVGVIPVQCVANVDNMPGQHPGMMNVFL